MDIEKINRTHLIKQDMLYRVAYGLSSRLLKFENGIIYLELEIRSKWNKTVDDAVNEISYCWRDNHPELSKALACRINVIDSKKWPYKRTLIHLGILPGPDIVKGLTFDKESSFTFS